MRPPARPEPAAAFTLTGLFTGLAAAAALAVVCVPIVATQMERRARSAASSIRRTEDSIASTLQSLDDLPASEAAESPVEPPAGTLPPPPEPVPDPGEPGAWPVLPQPLWIPVGQRWWFPPVRDPWTWPPIRRRAPGVRGRRLP